MKWHPIERSQSYSSCFSLYIPFTERFLKFMHPGNPHQLFNEWNKVKDLLFQRQNVLKYHASIIEDIFNAKTVCNMAK